MLNFENKGKVHAAFIEAPKVQRKDQETTFITKSEKTTLKSLICQLNSIRDICEQENFNFLEDYTAN